MAINHMLGYLKQILAYNMPSTISTLAIEIREISVLNYILFLSQISICHFSFPTFLFWNSDNIEKMFTFWD